MEWRCFSCAKPIQCRRFFKMRKFPRQCEENLLQWLDKNWVETFLEDIQSQSKNYIHARPSKSRQSCTLFSREILSLPCTHFVIFNRSSRQWFWLVNMFGTKSSSGSLKKEGSRTTTISFLTKRISLASPKQQNTGTPRSVSTYSEDDSELDPTNCYHPQCSFAYNIAGDVKQPSLITECLPFPTYQRLAALWNLDPYKVPRRSGNTCRLQNDEEEEEKVEEFIKNVERDLGIQSEISEDLQVNAGSPSWGGKQVKRRRERKDNPYVRFLKKTSDLEVEQRSKTNLGKKAGKITEMIIKNFLDWYQSLGGNDGETLIDEAALQELFQIGFDMPATKALVVKIREMPTVPEGLALLRNEPKHATRYGLRRFLKEDMRMENIPPRMFAFGRMLPKEKPSLRYKPPRNFVKKTWMECSRVPNDLDTMKTVWMGLEKLRSTIAFANWLKNHPEITPPTYLEQKGLLEINYERWNQMYKGFEMQADVFETTGSDSDKLIQGKISEQETKLSTSSSFKMESYDSV